MCGIAGIVGNADPCVAAATAGRIAHRGSVDSGAFTSPSGSCCLASRRFSIIDLSESGNVPTCNEDGIVWGSYNGEVYDFAEMRRRPSRVDTGPAAETAALAAMAQGRPTPGMPFESAVRSTLATFAVVESLRTDQPVILW